MSAGVSGSGMLQVCKSLRFSGVSVPRDYEQGFQRALWTFQHQRVWCPDRRQLVHLRPLPQGGLSAGQSCLLLCLWQRPLTSPRLGGNGC